MLAWLWPDEARRGRVIALTALAALGAHLLTDVSLGHAWLSSARGAVATVLQVVVTLAVHRWWTGDDNLVPHRPRDLVSLAGASMVGALAVIPLAPTPGVGVTSSTLLLSSWVALGAVHVFVGGACVLLLVQREPRAEALPTRLGVLYAQLVVTAVCLGLVFLLDGLPVTWLALLPAIWAGMTLGPWAAAAYSLTVSLTVALVRTLPAGNRPYGALDRTGSLVLDSLMAAFVFVVLLLALLRDQRAHLANEVVRRRQEALDQAGLLGTVYESITEGLVLMDADGDVQLHNRAAAHMLGPDRLTDEPARWLRRRRDAASFAYAYNRDGTEDGMRILSVQLTPVQYAGSDSVVAIVRDVTSEQRRIEELTSFAAVAAHDLKGPLAAVQGWIELAEDTVESDPAASLEALVHGRSAADRMSREIDDWLTYNVAREGIVHPEPVELQSFVETLVTRYPGARIEVEARDTVLVDQTLMRHLVVNLVGNAVKYTRPGEPPCLRVRSLPGPGPGWVRLEFSDTGIGIPEGEEAAVFEPFRRASTVRGRYDGSGLGLALCRRIVRRHGGVISAHRNESGPGTTVSLTLPRA